MTRRKMGMLRYAGRGWGSEEVVSEGVESEELDEVEVEEEGDFLPSWSGMRWVLGISLKLPGNASGRETYR